MVDTEVSTSEVIDSGPAFFGMIPHTVTDSDLSCEAFRLYCVYKMVCGESPDGRCWMSRKALARKCRKSVNVITAARRELELAGLICIKKARWRDGGHRLIVQLVNVWGKDFTLTDVQHEATKKPGTGCASAPAQDALPNNNQCNKNQDTSTSNEKESQVTHKRRPAASSKSGPEGHLPSGGINTQEEKKMTGFDLTNAPTNGYKPAPTYDQCAAEKLIDAIAKKLRLLRRPRVDVWTKDIVKFRRINQVSEEDFEERLAWYIEHIGDDFVPIVHSAKSFCDKIDQIGAAQLRSNAPPPRSHSRVESAADQITRLRQKGIIK